mmetsp:Transcript_122782/g.192735  ORF Transcript_122782/g.192735 Transcript_122782/m.192735 type:complete len:330 (-) Transcript_122782:93-1082(-)
MAGGRPSHVDIDDAARQLVEEVESRLAAGNISSLPPMNSGEGNLKKRFSIGTASAEKIYNRAAETLQGRGLYRMNVGAKLFVYFRTETDAKRFKSKIDELLQQKFSNLGGVGKGGYLSHLLALTTNKPQQKRPRQSDDKASDAPHAPLEDPLGPSNVSARATLPEEGPASPTKRPSDTSNQTKENKAPDQVLDEISSTEELSSGSCSSSSSSSSSSSGHEYEDSRSKRRQAQAATKSDDVVVLDDEYEITSLAELTAEKISPLVNEVANEELKSGEALNQSAESLSPKLSVPTRELEINNEDDKLIKELLTLAGLLEQKGKKRYRTEVQ